MSIEFEYFSCVRGRVVQRYGTDVYIGATRTASGWDWDEDRVVPIPKTECARYRREYLRAVRDKSIKERNQSDYDAYQKAQTELYKTKKPDKQEPDNSEVPVDKKDKKGGSK